MSAHTTGGTPLTRYGSRTATRSRTTTARTTTARPATPTRVEQEPTIRTMIIALPEELRPETLDGCRLDRHFGVCGTLTARFWVSPITHRWQRGQLVGLRKGKPALCAGGPVKLLDLAGMRHAAGVGAGIRHQIWHRAVSGTRPAQPWHQFHTRHLQDPDRYPYQRAVADFNNQPRLNAMRLHNTATYGPAQLPLHDLEAFQAGPVAYQHHCAATAIVADALLTADGHKIAPVSDALAHRVTYLQEAGRYLDTVEPGQRLLAVTL
jgi:hypothetical protein